MKKMRRFLSLLICMVMLMSFLPMGASAINFDYVTINVPIGTYQDAGTIVSKISAKGSRNGYFENDLNVTSTVTGTTYDNGEDIVFVTLSLTLKDGDTFKYLSDTSYYLNNQVSVNSGVNKSETSINSNKTVLTVKLSFRVTHKDHIFSDETDVDCICGFNRGVKVTFNSEKGTAPKAQTVVKGKTVSNPGAPTGVDGYTFGGWHTDEGCTQQYSFETAVNEPTDLYAKWTPTVYTITYHDANGAVNPGEYTIESESITLNNPANKEGYTFDGWTGTGLNEKTMTVTIPTGSYGPREYTANWEEVVTRDVRFHGPWNGYVSPVVKTKTVEDGKTVNADGVAVAGYLTPTEWGTYVQTGMGLRWVKYDFGTPVTRDLDLYANWTEAVTVSFDANGHGTAPAAQTIGKGATAMNPGAPENYNATAYTFDGWYLGENKFDFAKQKVGQSITLKAKWTVNPFTISYELNGGNLAEGVTNPTGYNFESAPIELNNPTKAGYTFAGWQGTGVEGTQTTVTIPTGSTGNRSYEAIWTPTTYTIGYDLAGGALAEGVTNPTDYTVESAAITLNNPTRTGYTFAGWQGTDVEGTQTTVTIPTGSTGNRSYKAIWTPITYTIGYDLAGGALAEGVTNPATYTAAAEEITLNNPTKAGYTFAGWTGTDVEGTQTTVTIPTGSTGNREYTATWTVETYEISYDLDGGSLAADKENPATYTIETEDFTLNNPTKADYTFAGWSGTDIEGAKIDVTIKKGSTGGRKYTANWTLTPVVVGIDVKPDDKQIYVGETQQFTAEVEIIGNIGKEVKWSVAPASGIALLSADETTIDENTGLLTANKPGKYIVTATSRANPDVYGTEEVEVLPLLTVKFDTNGKGTAPKDQNLKAGEKAVKPADPTAANYTFGGWYTDKDCTIAYVFDTEVETNITLYAKWNKIIYTVTYDANGGTGTMPVVNVEAGEGHTLVANEFKAPTGKTFKCWRVGLKDYKAGEKIDVTENVTVKAVWKNKTASSDLDYVPAAGDNFPTFLWAGLLLFSVIALAEVVSIRRKRS